jgi:hypothetical protein
MVLTIIRVDLEFRGTAPTFVGSVAESWGLVPMMVGGVGEAWATGQTDVGVDSWA